MLGAAVCCTIFYHTVFGMLYVVYQDIIDNAPDGEFRELQEMGEFFDCAKPTRRTLMVVGVLALTGMLISDIIGIYIIYM
jgi:hypothetical protein